MTARSNSARGFVELLRDLVEGGITLVRDEIRLAKLELSTAVQAAGVGTALVATGAVFGALGVLSLVVGLVLLIGDQWLPGDRYWIPALVLLVITGAVAAWLAKRGLTMISPRRLVPTETVTTLKEDRQWLKQRLTSGTTSR